MSLRPRIALIGRFTHSASALRYAGVVSSRALLESLWDAGADPVTLLAAADSDWEARLSGYQGVLLSGGGDINPARYGQAPDASVYDVDDVQDDSDFGFAEYALSQGIPTLAICRGMHVVNVLRGGTLIQDMPTNHRHVVQEVKVNDYESFGFTSELVSTSCYHHQAIDKLGTGLEVLGRGPDGTVEAMGIESTGWARGVQWHPEDTAKSDVNQSGIFSRLVKEARA
ncbi:MAG: gamma-glutamyl-gamma-aminobutyrate hydrolase family protein [Actinomycetes bacterium]